MGHFEQLEIFLKVVDEGSLAGAARALRLSRSHVSKNVQHLEDRLGVRLLHRTTRQLSLTDAGRAYHERAAQLLADLQEAELTLGEGRHSPRGVLRLSGPMSFGVCYLAPAVADFMNQHDALEIQLELADREVDLVAEGFDLAIRLGDLADSSLVARKLAPLPRRLCASPAYLARHGEPLTPDELRQHRCLRYSYARSGDAWLLRGRLGEAQVRVAGPLCANNGEALVEAALHDLGLVYLPEFFVSKHLHEGRLRPLLEGWTDHPSAIWALYPHSRHLSAKVRLFVDFLAARFSAAPLHQGWGPAAGSAAQAP
jgi:DNA-binding transcriptional LysR family regulator